MKQFFAFVRKEFFHIFRDRRTMLILLAMPVMLIVLFGFAITTEVNNIRLAVYAPSHDNLTRQIMERFTGNPYFEIVSVIKSPGQIDSLFRKNRVDVAVVFGDNFEHDLLHTGEASVQLIVDGSEPNTASLMSGYTTNILARIQQDLSAAMPAAGKGTMTIIPNVKLLYNPQMKSAYNFVPGVMGLILILICAMMTSISIVREKETGTMEIILVSPVRPINILLSKVVPYFCISAVNIVTIILLSVFVLKVPLAGSLFWISIMSLLYVFVSLALGILISSLVKTQVSAMMASAMGLMLPVMVLSGMIFPIETMPNVLQWLSAVIPARWYISGIKKLMIEGLPVMYAIKELIILAVMGAVMMFVSLKLFKNRLE